MAQDEVLKVLQARSHWALETPYGKESAIGSFEGFKQDTATTL